MTKFEDLVTSKNNDVNKLSSSQKVTGLRNMRTDDQKKTYDTLKDVDKKKLALDTLKSNEFQDTLRRYYTSRGDSSDFSAMGSQELIEYFYDDRVWRENNSIGLTQDLTNITGADDQQKIDFARISQTYADLPYFGRGAISFKKWAWDFGVAMVADPTNLIGFGVGAVVSKTAGKKALQEGTKAITKKAVTYGASVGAVEGGVATGGMDIIRQNTEMEANMSDEYDFTRTAIASVTGAGFGGVMGGGGAYIGSKWTSKKKNGNYVKEQDGTVIDRDTDFGEAGTNGDKTYSGETGTVKEHEATTNVKTHNGEIPQSKNTKTIETKETKTPKKKDNTRGTYINFKHYDPQNPEATPAVKEIKQVLQKVKKEGKIRTKVREGLLTEILEKAKVKVNAKDQSKFEIEVKKLLEVDEDMAVNNVALKIQMLQEADQAVKLKAEGAKISPDDKVAQVKLLSEKKILVDSIAKKIIQKDTISRMASDTLNSEKIDVPLDSGTTQTYLKTEEVADMMKTIDDLKVDPVKQEQVIDDLIENLSNEYHMKSIIQKHAEDGSKRKANWADALNEFTTANLLGDLTTHQINIASAVAKYQKGIVDDLVGGFMHGFSSKNRHMMMPQLSMAMDMMLGQFRFWGIALRKAKLSWKSNRSVGDALEHKFDGVKERQMAEWTRQLREEGGMVKKLASYPLDAMGRLSFTTLKALQFGDTLMKNVFQRAGRVAHVNQRMRKFYPEIWNQRKGNKRNIVKLEENIRHMEAKIRFAKNQKKDVSKLEAKLIKLQNKRKSQTTFEKKWSELYFEYEDKFGDFRSTKNFTDEQKGTLDDLTSSIANDPMYKAQESTFTQSLKSKELNLKDSKGNDVGDGWGDSLLKWAHNHPFMRTALGLHFIKTPTNLLRYAWYNTPALNMANKQYRAMWRHPDPVIRAKAKTYMATGVAMYSGALGLAMNGNITGGSNPDTNKKYSYVHTDKDGNKKYYNFARLWPLSIPLMITADIVEGGNKWNHTFNDPNRRASQKKWEDHAMFVAGHMMAMFTNTFTSNFMVADAFKLMSALVDNSARDPAEADSLVETTLKDLNRKSTKIIPLATTWRWTNKIIAEQEAESRTILEEWVKSTPFELAKKLGIPYGDLYAKRDMFGNELPAPKGALLGSMQDISKTTEGIANHEDFAKLTAGQKDLLTRLVNESGWNKPRAKIRVGLATPVDLNSLEVVYKGKLQTPDSELTAYEAWQIEKGQVKIKGKTLNEMIFYQINDPSSALNKYTVDKLISGKYNQAEFLKSIVKEYENYAKDIVFRDYKVRFEGQIITINDIEKIASKSEFLSIKEGIKNK